MMSNYQWVVFSMPAAKQKQPIAKSYVRVGSFFPDLLATASAFSSSSRLLSNLNIISLNQDESQIERSLNWLLQSKIQSVITITELPKLGH
jgi:hypothetical protein